MDIVKADDIVARLREIAGRCNDMNDVVALGDIAREILDAAVQAALAKVKFAS